MPDWRREFIIAVMKGRARSRISFRRVEGTGSSLQVFRGLFLKTYFPSSSDTAWYFDKYNPAKSGCWTFSCDTSKFSLIFIILEVKKSKKYDWSWSEEAAGKAGIAFFFITGMEPVLLFAEFRFFFFKLPRHSYIVYCMSDLGG